MLAISVQGMLFAGATTTVLGWNGLGIAVGSGLVGAWAAAQGVLLQLLLIGSDLLLAYQSAIYWVTARWQLGEVGVTVGLGAWITGYGLVAAAATREPRWRSGER